MNGKIGIFNADFNFLMKGAAVSLWIVGENLKKVGIFFLNLSVVYGLSKKCSHPQIQQLLIFHHFNFLSARVEYYFTPQNKQFAGFSAADMVTLNGIIPTPTYLPPSTVPVFHSPLWMSDCATCGRLSAPTLDGPRCRCPPQ